MPHLLIDSPMQTVLLVSHFSYLDKIKRIISFVVFYIMATWWPGGNLLCHASHLYKHGHVTRAVTRCYILIS